MSRALLASVCAASVFAMGCPTADDPAADDDTSVADDDLADDDSSGDDDDTYVVPTCADIDLSGAGAAVAFVTLECDESMTGDHWAPEEMAGSWPEALVFASPGDFEVYLASRELESHLPCAVDFDTQQVLGTYEHRMDGACTTLQFCGVNEFADGWTATVLHTHTDSCTADITSLYHFVTAPQMDGTVEFDIRYWRQYGGWR